MTAAKPSAERLHNNDYPGGIHMSVESQTTFEAFLDTLDKNKTASDCLRSTLQMTEDSAAALLESFQAGGSHVEEDIYAYCQGSIDKDALLKAVCRRFGFDPQAARTLMQNTADLFSPKSFDDVKQKLKDLSAKLNQKDSSKLSIELARVDTDKLAAAYYASFYAHNKPFDEMSEEKKEKEKRTVEAIGYSLALQKNAVDTIIRSETLGHENDQLLEDLFALSVLVLFIAVNGGAAFLLNMKWQVHAALYLLTFFGGLYAIALFNDSVEGRDGTLHERQKNRSFRERMRSLDIWPEITVSKDDKDSDESKDDDEDVEPVRGVWREESNGENNTLVRTSENRD